ncbi:MAG: outer membrane protein assembly factor BamB [Betaproteobacteria bacterium]
MSKVAMTTSRKPSLIALAIGIAVAFAGCSWFGKDEKPPAPLPDNKGTATARVLWQQSLESAGQTGFAPAVTVDGVYAASAEGALAGFDPASGKVNWRIKTGAKLSAGVGAEGGLVVVGTAKGEILAFDKTGASKWKARVSSEVLGPPRVSGNTVAVWSGDGNVFGLDAADGARRWVLQRTMPALSVRNQAGGIIARGAIFLGVAGGKLLAIDLEKGILGWEGTVAQPKGATELERIADVTSLPAISATAVCAAAYQGRVACFEPNRGNFLWSRDIPGKDGIVLDNRHLYVTDDKGAIHALDNATGASVWKQDKLVTRSPSGPQLIGDYLAVVDYQGYVHLLDRNDGSLVARVATDGSAATAQPVVSGEGIVVQTHKGALFSVVAR